MRAAAETAATNPTTIELESLTISRDVMPHHYIARAVILDLQPADIVSGIAAAMDAIQTTYPNAVRTGWSACCDGLRIYFYAWTLAGGLNA